MLNWLRAGRANRSSSPNGPQMERFISSLTAPTGGISTGCAMATLSRCTRKMPSLACRNGSLVCPPTASSQLNVLFAGTPRKVRRIYLTLIPPPASLPLFRSPIRLSPMFESQQGMLCSSEHHQPIAALSPASISLPEPAKFCGVPVALR